MLPFSGTRTANAIINTSFYAPRQNHACQIGDNLSGQGNNFSGRSFSRLAQFSIFDNGCGYRVFNSIMKSKFPNVHLLATDILPIVFEHEKSEVSKESWRD